MTRSCLATNVKRALLSAALAAASTVPLHAQSWNIDAASSWATAANWNPATVPDAIGAAANITFNISAARTISLNGSRTIGSLTLGDPTASYFAYTIAPGTPTTSQLIFDQTGVADATISIPSTVSTGANVISAGVLLNDNLVIDAQTPFNVAALNISGVITDGAGSSSLTKTGATSSITISGSNTYDGGTMLNAGRIAAGNISAFGTGTVNIAAGGQAFFSVGGTVANDFNIAGVGFNETAGNLGAIRLTGTTLSGTVNLTADARITAHGSTGTITGNITQTAGQNYTLELANLNTGTASTITLNNTTTVGGLALGTNNTGTLNVVQSVGQALTITDATKAIQVGASSTVTPFTAQTFTINGTVTNPGSLNLGRNGNLNTNTGSSWTQSGNISLTGYGGYSATANINTGSLFTYSGTNLINLNGADGNGGQAKLNIAGGTFVTGMGFQQTTASTTGFGRVTLTNSGTLRLSAPVADLTVFDGFNPTVQLDLGTGGGTIDTNGFDGGISYGITGTGNLTKAGLGKLTLSGPTAYTGNTLVTAGTLALVDATSNNNLSQSPTITIDAAGTLDVTGVSTPGGFIVGSAQKLGGTGTIIGNLATQFGAEIIPGGAAAKGTLAVSNNLTLNDGKLSFDLDPTSQTIGGGVNDLISVTGTFDVAANSTIAITSFGLPTPGIYSYRLMNYGTAGAGTGTLALDTSAIGQTRSTYALSTTIPGQVNFNVTAVAALSLKWVGNDGVNPGVWDLNNSTNWVNGVTPEKFFDQDSVTFDDTAVTANVTVPGNVLPGSITINNSLNPYVFTGSGVSISGGYNLTKQGTSMLSFSGITLNTTGTLTVQDGSTVDLSGEAHSIKNVTLNNGTITGNGSVNMANGTINATSGTVDVSISGANLTINKTTDGRLILGKVNTFTNSTINVENGILEVNALLGIPASNTVKLGTAGSGTSITVFEIPFSSAADQLVISTPLIVSSDAPDSTAIIRFTGSDSSASANYNGTIALQNRDLYVENDTSPARLYALSGAITGTGDVHINTSAVSLGGNRVRITSTANTFIGDVYLDSGMLQIFNGSGGTNNVIPNTANLIFSAGTRVGMGTSDTVNALIGGAADPLALPNPLPKALITANLSSTSSTATITVGANNGSGVFHGDINDLTGASGGGGMAVTKIGSGTQGLTSDTSTYIGITAVNAGVLQVSKLSDGGTASSIGAATNITSRLIFGGGSLDYIGTGDSTNKLFTFSASTKISNNGTSGPLLFTNTGSTAQTLTTARTLTLGGTNTSLNSFAPIIGNVTGGTGLEKADAGTWELLADNTYAGGTLVSAGTLLANNTAGSATGTGAVTVASGATLGGTGFISGLTTVDGGIAPGTAGIGTLTINNNNNVTWNAGNSWVFDLGTAGLDLLNPGASDLLNIVGDYVKGTGSTFTFDFANSGEAGWYKLVDWSGTTAFVSSDFAGTNLATGLAPTFTVDVASSALYVNLMSVTGINAWQGGANALWSSTSSWTNGSVPNGSGATDVASFLGMGVGTVTVDIPQMVNQVVFNAASPNYTIGGPSTLSLAGNTPSITNSTGSNTISAPLNLGNGTAINVSGGTLAISPTAANTIGTGVTATVVMGATLQLGGTGNGLSSTVNVANNGTLAATTAGKLVGNISGTGTTTVTAAGATLTANHVRQAGLTIGAGNTVTVAPNGTDSGTSTVTNLNIDATGKLDLNDNDLVVDNGNLATLTAQLATGLDINGSYGNGPGITSTAFANNVDFNTVLGIAANVELGYTSFSGQTVDTNDVLIKYTYYGDADLSGSVDTATDFDLYITGLTSGGSLGGWLFGDFDYSGTVDSATDFDLYITGLTTQGSPLLTAAGGNLVQAVPEPSTFVLGGLALLGFAGAGIRRRRVAGKK